MKNTDTVSRIHGNKIRAVFRKPISVSEAMRRLGLSSSNGAQRRSLLGRAEAMGIEIAYARKRPRKGDPVTKNCDTCGSEFVVADVRSIQDRRFCSRKCYAVGRRVSRDEQLRRRRVRRGLQRECGRCISCGGSVGDLALATCEKCRDRSANYRSTNQERIKEARREANQKLKARVIGHYGNRCACCGEDDIYFLSIDHVNSDGSEHRRLVKEETGSNGIYRWLVSCDFDHSYELRVLCYNCNLGRRVTGVCPHQSSMEK